MVENSGVLQVIVIVNGQSPVLRGQVQVQEVSSHPKMAPPPNVLWYQLYTL